MMQPKRTKFRKQFKGRIAGNAQRGNTVAFGEYGLKATDRARMTAREIEAARRAISRHVKRGGRIWIRVFPDVPITQKPLEVRMGSREGVVRDRRHERGDRARGVPPGVREALGVDGVRQAAGADMKAKDLRGKAAGALNEDLLRLRREQFNLRMARATGQPAKPDQFAKVRKNIARVKTVLAQSSDARRKV
jgi:ribosomal protein L16/ribosomal protein L29